MTRARALLACVIAGALAALGCTDHAPAGEGAAETPTDTAEVALLAELRRFESEQRARVDFGAAPPSDARFGPDPYRIVAAGPDRAVGVLRGADSLVLLDAELREIARVPAPSSPSGLALAGDTAYVAGELEGEIRPYRVTRDGLEAGPPIALPDAHALRDVAAGPGGVVYAVEEARGRLFTIVPDAAAPEAREVTSVAAGAGAIRVVRTKTAVAVLCLLDHHVAVYRVDARGRPQGAPAILRNDGPLWALSAIEELDRVLVASGGVEDRPLDRTHGSFENIDSFLYLDRVELGSGSRADAAPAAVRLAAINLSELGVVVPKALALSSAGEGIAITATGYGGDVFAALDLDLDGKLLRPATVRPLWPGTSAIEPLPGGGLAVANPLFDAWLLVRPGSKEPAVRRVTGPRDGGRAPASLLGEALLFTTLMAPWNRSDGPLSRFTCETCHFEGYVDGRTHATGRGDVRATTKPLLGLFNNRPHFSRALDPDLSSVAHNEFRVAGARSDHSPVFDLKVTDRPWFAGVGLTDVDLTAPALRRAFMTFVMEQSHRRSAITAGRAAFTDDERRGAAVFRDRCEGCHEARLASDEPGSRVAFERWEREIFSDAAPIVWGQARYAKTGVEPYVHPEGARVPSLRRLYKKHPYFTNGSAKSLAEVLARARSAGDTFFHDGAPEGAVALPDGERAPLEAFLLLL